MKQVKPRQTVEATEDRDTMRLEYDFSGAVRGVTAARYAKGTDIVVVDLEMSRLNKKCVDAQQLVHFIS
jgi:hypothetical protein